MNPDQTIFKQNATDQDNQELTLPLECLLTAGGDSRLHVDPVSLLNGYGCRPWPRPEAFTFASSTATSISHRGFAAAATTLQNLVEFSKNRQVEVGCDRQAELLRERIKVLLGLQPSQADIVFSPSGTDSQVHAFYLAQGLLDGPQVTIIAGSDETGSGTSRAMTGCHFSSGTAQGSSVIEGRRIAGFAEDTSRMEIPLRDGNGELRSANVIDQEVLTNVAGAVASGKRVILHVMDTSKFGSRCPSPLCLRQIRSNWGKSVQIVVDACQMRLSRRRLQYYLAQNFIVFITGSKFLTGPPLSGALLVPAAVAARMKQNVAVPAGLALYTNRIDWPITWGNIRSKLPSRPNVGQLLRWAAALEELRAYFAVPDFYRSLALREFSEVVSHLIAGRPNLELVPSFERAAPDEIDDEEMAARTIFPFFVASRGTLLSVEACARIYRALNRDVSNLLPRNASSYKRQLAAQLCHVGQPVKVVTAAGGCVGTLRISAGARVVSETWRSAGMAASLNELKKEFEQVRTILDKIDLLLENIDALESLDEAPIERNAESSGFASSEIPESRIQPRPDYALNRATTSPFVSGAKDG